MAKNKLLPGQCPPNTNPVENLRDEIIRHLMIVGDSVFPRSELQGPQVDQCIRQHRRERFDQMAAGPSNRLRNATADFLYACPAHLQVYALTLADEMHQWAERGVWALFHNHDLQSNEKADHELDSKTIGEWSTEGLKFIVRLSNIYFASAGANAEKKPASRLDLNGGWPEEFLKLSPTNRAIIMKSQYPDLKDKEIAIKAGVGHPSNLSRDKKYQRFKSLGSNPPPPGTKSKSGDIEAESND